MVSVGSYIPKGKRQVGHLLSTGPKKGDPIFEAWDEELYGNVLAMEFDASRNK